jgi:predicted DNA-binding transcriptional regulator YafY
VTLRAPAAEVAERLRHLGGELTPLDAATSEYRTSDDSLDWLALRIAMLGVEFVVEEPPELAARFRALAGRFARAVGGDAG